jgi:catechol 2,3-dioxygenase-like lactoylglutathione lyase family enzyme
MASLSFDHLAIPVADAAHARELFGDILELPLIAAYTGDDWDGAPWLMMIYGLNGGGQIALCALADGRSLPKPATDLPHYAFSVRDRATLQRWRRKLKSAGFAPRDEDHGHQLSVYFEDRTGTTWEITAPPSRNRPDAEAGTVITDWLAKHSNPGRNGPDTSATGPNR